MDADRVSLSLTLNRVPSRSLHSSAPISPSSLPLPFWWPSTSASVLWKPSSTRTSPSLIYHVNMGARAKVKAKAKVRVRVRAKVKVRVRSEILAEPVPVGFDHPRQCSSAKSMTR